MLSQDLLYQLALGEVAHIGAVHAKTLYERYDTALDVFRASQADLERIEGIGQIRARNIRQFNGFKKLESEIAFIEKYGLQTLFIKDERYPQRLRNCYDPPALLFYKGTADLNAERIISVVGTRRNSPYGKQATQQLVKTLSDNNVLVVSGLAFGIDAVAHRTCVDEGGNTVAVIAHGLDTIYPSANTGLAREMMKNGGLLTEFKSRTKPDKHHFPSRNRIVAGMSDATIVIESHVKGGSMITAEIASGYHREVFAVPGRITDNKSSGCNELIRNNKAVLLQDASQLLEIMHWIEHKPATPRPAQGHLFSVLTENERKIVSALSHRDDVHIEEISKMASLGTSVLAGVLLTLEMRSVLQSLPGRRYRLLQAVE